MKKIVKQVAGIDVAQKELVVSLGKMYDDSNPVAHIPTLNFCQYRSRFYSITSLGEETNTAGCYSTVCNGSHGSIP